MKFIHQEDERGCSIASVAMATGLTYQFIKELASDTLKWDNFQWRWMMEWLGYECGSWELDTNILENQNPVIVRRMLDSLPKDTPFVLFVIGKNAQKNPEDSHMMAFENGLVYDPLEDKPGVYDFSHYQQRGNIYFMFSVRDRRVK